MSFQKQLKFLYNKWLLTALVFGVAIYLLLVIKPEGNLVKFRGVVSTDSAFMLLEKAPVGGYEKELTDYCFSRLLKNDSTDQFKLILEKFKKRIHKDNTDRGNAYLNVLDVSNFNPKPVNEANKIYADAVTVGQETRDTNLILFAQSYFSVNKIKFGSFDSARTSSKYGYDLALKSKNDRFIYFFANNLGFLMNGVRWYGAAQMYFEQALKSADAIKLDKSVLLNNMLSIMITEKNEREANQLWQKYFEPFKVDTFSYVGQLFTPAYKI